MRRIACLLLCAASLAAVAAPARAQQSPFGPLPQEAAPTATPTPAAPWHLIEGDSKRWARVKVVETVCERIEAAL